MCFLEVNLFSKSVIKYPYHFCDSTGPIVSALTNKYGCRVVCVAGAVVGATGFGLSSLSPNLSVLMITYGVIGGNATSCFN